MNAFEVASRIQAKTGHNAAWRGSKLNTRCPAHQDGNPSLSITTGRDGKVLLKCHAGCTVQAICEASGIKTADLFPLPPQSSLPAKGRKEVASYRYVDEKGTLLFEVVRFEPKTFRQRRPDPHSPGKLIWNVTGVRQVPYRLPEARQSALDGKPVIIVEGEKDADNLAAWGYAATCNAGGAGKWTDAHTQALGTPREVVVIPDLDEPGRQHAEKVCNSLAAHGIPASLLILPTEREGRKVKDFTDWSEAGGTPGEFLAMLDRARESAPEDLPPDSSVSSVSSVSNSLVADGLGGMRKWPEPPSAVAFHGLFGELVNRVSPHTEADRVALLVHALVFFGNVIGRKPHWMVNATRHGGNLFAVCVGPTGNGRKGTASDIIKALFSSVDSPWVDNCIKSGLVSGEGLCFHVRDANEAKGDEGVRDKRLLVNETEFSRVFTNMQRRGSTISSEMRKAWDGSPLESLAKNCPIRASEHHISIIGHIVRDELLSVMEKTEAVNGFGNRLLFACVKQAQLLPLGGEIPPVDRQFLVNGFATSVRSARECGLVLFTEEAVTLWSEVYRELNVVTPGVVGSLLGRAAAYVRRLAMLYALADCSAKIAPEHLQAALALWRYAEVSCRYVFGESTGNTTADRIRHALRDAPSGLTRTQINDLFQGNKSAESISLALDLLSMMGQLRTQRETHANRGRPSDRYFLASSTFTAR